MNREYTQSQKLKRAAVAAIVGFALATLFYKLGGGASHGCELLDEAEWLVLQILHPIVAVGWRSAQAYLTENSRVLQHLPQIVANAWPMLCFVVA
jgi:hypothetical protein